MKVRVNLAMSADGRIAGPDGAPLRLSDEADLARVHRMRHESDAILVGVGTVLKDDPSLLTKARFVPDPRQPVRVVLDGSLRTPRGARVLDAAAPTLVYTTRANAGRVLAGAEVVAAGDGGVRLPLVLRDLEARGHSTLMVEGGGRVIASFLREGLVDELTVYVAPVVVGGGAPSWAEGSPFSPPLPLRLVRAERLGEGVLLTYHPRTAP